MQFLKVVLSLCCGEHFLSKKKLQTPVFFIPRPCPCFLHAILPDNLSFSLPNLNCSNVIFYNILSFCIIIPLKADFCKQLKAKSK